MKKEYLYLAIAGVILYIIVQNKKDEKQENRIITIGGRRYWDEPIKWEDTKPAQPKKPQSELIDEDAKAGRNGYEFIS